MPIQDIDPPPIEALDLSYTKTFLRVDGIAEDRLIEDQIQSARVRIETLLGMSLIRRRRLYSTSAPKGCGIFINHGQIVSIETIKAVFKDGSSENIPLEKFDINLRCAPASLRLKHGIRWTLSGRNIVALDIELIAGYGPVSDDIPMPIRQAILLLVADSYEHRLQDINKTPRRSIPMMVDALLMPYRTLKL